MVTLANQRDDDWPISKYQETPAANQPLPTPCLCSKLINTAVLLLRALLKTPLHWMRWELWLELAIKPLYAFALLWTSYSLSFWDLDSGHNTHITTYQTGHLKGPTEQHSKLKETHCDNLHGKRSPKRTAVHLFMTESSSCTPKT